MDFAPRSPMRLERLSTISPIAPAVLGTFGIFLILWQLALPVGGRLANFHDLQASRYAAEVTPTTPRRLISLWKEPRANATQPSATDSPRLFTGTIQSTFFASARQAGLSPAIIDEFADLFSSRIEFKHELRRGASFSALVDLTGKSKKQLLAAALLNGGRLYAAVQYGPVSKPQYFDESGNLIGKEFLRYPLQFSRITSVFSSARYHPLLGVVRPHNGVDFAAPIGTAVRTVCDGVIVTAEQRGEAGLMVQIRHGPRYSTEYFHLASIAKGIRPGARVERGQLIGRVGMSGASTGPHLHFALFDRGRYINPLSAKARFLEVEEARIPATALQSVLAKLGEGFYPSLSRRV